MANVSGEIPIFRTDAREMLSLGGGAWGGCHQRTLELVAFRRICGTRFAFGNPDAMIDFGLSGEELAWAKVVQCLDPNSPGKMLAIPR